MTTVLKFGAAGLPVRTAVPAGKPTRIDLTNEGMQELARSMGHQGVRAMEYNGIAQWSANMVGVVHAADGSMRPIVDDFARYGVVPNTGTPGLLATQLDSVAVPALAPGERAELWVEALGRSFEADQPQTAYWSNFGRNINLYAEGPSTPDVG